MIFAEEDMWAKYSQLLIKYFCAEGVVSGHAVTLASTDEHPNYFVQVRKP